MNLLYLSKQLHTELKKESPNRIVVTELITNLYKQLEPEDCVAYVAHLWDITFEGTMIEESTKDWYLHWIAECRDNALIGWKNLRVSEQNDSLVFMHSSNTYENCFLRDVPPCVRSTNDEVFNSDWYLAIEGYIRKNCDLRRIDECWLCAPYLV